MRGFCLPHLSRWGHPGRPKAAFANGWVSSPCKLCGANASRRLTVAALVKQGYRHGTTQAVLEEGRALVRKRSAYLVSSGISVFVVAAAIAGATIMPIKARAIRRSCIKFFSSQGFLQLAHKTIIFGIGKILNTTKTQLRKEPVSWASPTKVVSAMANYASAGGHILRSSTSAKVTIGICL